MQAEVWGLLFWVGIFAKSIADLAPRSVDPWRRPQLADAGFHGAAEVYTQAHIAFVSQRLVNVHFCMCTSAVALEGFLSRWHRSHQTNM